MVEKIKQENNEGAERLKKQLQWYKSFFENATDAVFIVQPDTWSVLDANDFAASLLETTREDLIGSNLPQFRRLFKLLKKSSAPTVLSELNLSSSSQKELMVEVSARFFEYDGQRLIQAIARDVSEQHALTDKLVQTDKLVLLGQLSAGVSHEIKNPLAAVKLNLQALKRTFEEDSPEFNYSKNALQGVQRISRIVEVTLNFSRPAPPDIKELDLNALIPVALDLSASMLKKKEIKVELNLNEKIKRIAADEKQIQQALVNIITNAADSIKNKGAIKIKTYEEKGGRRAEGTYSIVSISDSGKGIPPEDLPKIFNPFFTRKADGTGLGLPITQRIMHQHSGVIDVESSVGKGATFYLKLPAK